MKFFGFSAEDSKFVNNEFLSKENKGDSFTSYSLFVKEISPETIIEDGFSGSVKPSFEECCIGSDGCGGGVLKAMAVIPKAITAIMMIRAICAMPF